MHFYPLDPSVTPEPLNSTLPPLQSPPATLSQFRMSEMNTASPRIPSPLDTAGMMAVVSAPGLAGQGTAQRGLAGGNREERTLGNTEEQSRPAGEGGLAGKAGGLAGRSSAPGPSSPRGCLSFQPPIGSGHCCSDVGFPSHPLSLAAGQRLAATIGPAPRYFRWGGRRRCPRDGRSSVTYCGTAPTARPVGILIGSRRSPTRERLT